MLKSGPCGERRGYHHGALRDALVDAARQLVADRGPVGFTLVDAARQCGVSAAAPYRHFRDLNALLDEVARRGFSAFAARLEAAGTAAGKAYCLLPTFDFNSAKLSGLILIWPLLIMRSISTMASLKGVAMPCARPCFDTAPGMYSISLVRPFM